MKHIFNQSLIDKCYKFAKTRIKGSGDQYKQRGEQNSSKIIDDLVIGLLGEYAVYEFFKSIGVPCTKPDLEIYGVDKKSYKADLTTDKNNIHVKSQSFSSLKRYGSSWIFQTYDPLLRTEDPSEMLALVSVNLDKNEANILGFVRAVDISKANLWEECRVFSYRKTKKAIYLKSLFQAGVISPLDVDAESDYNLLCLL